LQEDKDKRQRVREAEEIKEEYEKILREKQKREGKNIDE